MLHFLIDFLLSLCLVLLIGPNMRSFFDINLIDFGDDWDKQCTEINALFPELFMLFQQFCFSVVGEYEQVQALLCIRAQQSTAQHSTRMKAQHSTAQQNIAEQRAEWAHTTQRSHRLNQPCCFY